jgi:hypothetical protein
VGARGRRERGACHAYVRHAPASSSGVWSQKIELSASVVARAPSNRCGVARSINKVCHGEDPAVAGDAAIHLNFCWIATPDFVGLAMTNESCSFACPAAARGEAIQLPSDGSTSGSSALAITTETVSPHAM